jgi:hypothetical protein
MNINPFEQYRVVETAQVIAIVPASAQVKDANNLIIADIETCGQYLVRYTEHRAAGKEIKAAHELALRGANIISNVKPS